ncbi:probable LRR receptor-like serine/threonine-protein kinase At3g47570 [Prosopis cineraria]|uniref:probable LRR receptor-like serine/threonine-protein kinase At3g47570 n=1 Tax=Prosopis cineraria TaxID=364024 RepID=UPI00240F860F|nr:probable LRR receptor-like serine/threonine-protein kinase At3g47570 [Prosopis cineraria]
MKPFPVWSQNLHLLLFFTLIFQSCRGAASSPSLGNKTDHLSLLKFKESISEDPYHILDSWNASTHFCNWHGITCGHKHHRVTRLVLEDYQLSGTLSPFIGNLSFIRYISLGANKFHGEIPQEFGHLFRLQELYLENNTLTGEFPVNVTSCSNLRYFSFGGNHLIGKIPMEIDSLQKLEEIYLPVNNFTGEIPISIGNISSLRLLSLGRNNLEGTVPETLGHLQKLGTIAIGSNKLSGTIPSSIYNLSSLTWLGVANNQLNGSLPVNMFLTLPNLQLVEVDMNQFSGPIPTSLVNASRLVRLALAANHLTGLVPDLGKSHDLSVLNIGHNDLGSNSAEDLEFLKSLINCSKLKAIELSSSNFGGHLPNFIGNLSTHLKGLYLSDNQISGEIPEALGNLVNLWVIDMDNNHLTNTIPTTFGKLQKMQALYLVGNRLSGEITPFIGNLSQLFDLDLSGNMLEGPIPPSIRNCQKLQKLDLSRNKFSNTMPVEIFDLPSLSILLNLSHNSFSGKLPKEVGKLKNIDELDFSHNHLPGNIPETIGDCKSLEYLFLQGNFFQEIIPLSLASLKGLRYLDLSENNLSGSVPKELQDISVLEYLNVSFNMLDGEVPKRGVFSNASAISLTGNSELCGGIPDLKLPPCLVKVTGERKHHTSGLVAAICCVVAFLLILSSILAIYYYKRKRSKKYPSNSPAIDMLPKVSFQSLHNATNGFSANNMIGFGRFGSVYKGSLESHDVVAIKVLNLQIKGADKSFVAECNSLKNRRHRNMVKIVTCCSSIDFKGHEFKALVYEYMVNGSLENWLHPGAKDQVHPRILILDQIINILLDVASALQYLHHECEQPLVHCDLKPSNVLLDGDMVAHLSDFGLARIFSTIEGKINKQSSTIGIKGTIGYVPPEYGMGLDVSIQGDMYSFGILILEMLTKKRPTADICEDGHNLHKFVEIAFPDKLLEVVNPSILPRESEHRMQISEGSLEDLIQVQPNVVKCLCSLVRIGLACSVESPHERISAVEVVRELISIKSSFTSRPYKLASDRSAIKV